MRHVVNEIVGIIPPEEEAPQYISLMRTQSLAEVFLKLEICDKDYHFIMEYKVKDGLQSMHIWQKKSRI